MHPKHPMYDLPPPNDQCYDLRSLTFGRRSYSQELGELGDLDYKKSPLHYLSEHGSWQRYSDWRMRLGSPDPMACIPIWEGPPSSAYAGKAVYDPGLLEELLVKHPRVVATVSNIVRDGYQTRSFRALYTIVMSIFKNEYWAVLEQVSKQKHELIEEARKVGILDYQGCEYTFEYDKALAVRQFDKAADIVCKFLVRHHDLYPKEWLKPMVEHADLSHYMKLFSIPGAVVKPVFGERPKSKMKLK